MIFHMLDDDVDHQMAQEPWRKRTLISIFHTHHELYWPRGADIDTVEVLD